MPSSLNSFCIAFRSRAGIVSLVNLAPFFCRQSINSAQSSLFTCGISLRSTPSVSLGSGFSMRSSFIFLVFFFIAFIQRLYTAAALDLPAAFARCSIAIAACILCACFLPELLILRTLASASLTVANFSPCIVPFGFSSVYRSLCFLLPAFCPFLRGMRLPSAIINALVGITPLYASVLSSSITFGSSSSLSMSNLLVSIANTTILSMYSSGTSSFASA